MIKDFKAGIKVCQAVLVRVQKVGNSSNGGVFARGMLEDNSGRIAFICFDAVLVAVYYTPLTLPTNREV